MTCLLISVTSVAEECFLHYDGTVVCWARDVYRHMCQNGEGLQGGNNK
jgi:hypothetical protein